MCTEAGSQAVYQAHPFSRDLTATDSLVPSAIEFVAGGVRIGTNRWRLAVQFLCNRRDSARFGYTKSLLANKMDAAGGAQSSCYLRPGSAMLRIYQAQHVVEAYIVSHLLQRKGVETEVFYDDIHGSGLGPFMQASVWLVDHDDAGFARRLIREQEQSIRNSAADEHYKCDHCGESNPSTFEVCWSCEQEIEQTPRPPVTEVIA